MTRYLIKQFLLSIAKLFVFLTIMFFFIQIMMPGDFVDQYALMYDTEERQAIREQFGLDLPLWQQYTRWLGNIVQLDFGDDLFGHGEPMGEILKGVIPLTLLVFFTGAALAFLIGLWLGKGIAWRGPGLITGGITLGGLVLFTSFPPWLAWLMTHFLTDRSDFLIMGSISGLRLNPLEEMLDYKLWGDSEVSPETIVCRMLLSMMVAIVVVLAANWVFKTVRKRGLPGVVQLLLIALGTLAGWYAVGIQDLAFDILGLAWLSILTFTLLSFGESMILMQSSLTEVMKEEYITTAFAKGLPSSVVREKHGARNAILPVLSRLVISLPYLLTGVVIVENSLGWPGLGSRMWNALYWQNLPLVMNVLLIVGVLSLVARLFLDVLMTYLDPRIRYS